MTDISKHTLNKIKAENVCPIPRHYFLFKHSILWSLFGFSMLLGSIASGIAIFILTHVEWDIYYHLSKSLIGFILLVFPYVWISFLIGFSIFAFLFFRRTEQGYRYKTILIVLFSIMSSVFGGAMLYKTELPERLESAFQKNIPFYRELDHRRKVWMSPEKGLLAGRIISVRSNKSVQLEDLNGMMWDVHVGNAQWRGNLNPSENLKIKIIGKMISNNEFFAKEIRPWEGKKQRGRKQNTKRGNYR